MEPFCTLIGALVYPTALDLFRLTANVAFLTSVLLNVLLNVRAIIQQILGAISGNKS